MTVGEVPPPTRWPPEIHPKTAITLHQQSSPELHLGASTQRLLKRVKGISPLPLPAQLLGATSRPNCPEDHAAEIQLVPPHLEENTTRGRKGMSRSGRNNGKLGIYHHQLGKTGCLERTKYTAAIAKKKKLISF